MKKIIGILSVLIITTISLNAKVWTVSNNPVDSAAANFSEVQKAIDVASSGDTIYVNGSLNSYGDVIIDKQLTLIGNGYHPNNQFQLPSIISAISFDNGSGSSKIVGFKIEKESYSSTQISFINTVQIQNITIERNFFPSNHNLITLPAGKVNNVYIINNIFTGGYYHQISIGNNLNINISNNIFYGGSNFCIGDSNNSSVIISNNFFRVSGGGTFSLTHAIIVNNVFFETPPTGADYCTFNNNISYGGTSNEFLFDHNTGSNNLENIDPIFSNVGSSGFSFDFNYNLKDTSPGKNAGTDGTDIGIYGGPYPFPSGGDVPWQTSAMPAIPQVLEMNIQNAVIPADEDLHIQVKAKIQQ